MRVPRREIKKRGAELRRRRVGGIHLSERNDVYYLSGFTGEDSDLLITQSRQVLITDFRFVEEAAASAPLFEVLTWKKNRSQFGGDLARSLRIKKLGFSPEHVNVTAHAALKRGAGGVQLVKTGDLLPALRNVKSKWEVARISTALRCAEAAFRAVRKRIRPGMTEIDLRLDLEWEMRRRGASDAAFESIIAAGANASRCHAHAQKRKVCRGGLVLLDFGACVDRYNSDLTRVLFLGSISRTWKRRYELTLEAQRAGMERIAAGVKGADCDRAARDVFARAGCAKAFGHSLGHGIGLAVHEGPSLSSSSKTELARNAIVTVEPGLYYPRQGGVRIEDMVLVTAKGYERLSRLPRSLNWAVI